jgi:hypothetical protein
MQVIHMSVASSVAHVARNLATGHATQWDLEYLQAIGVRLNEDQAFRIAHGLTTVDDAESLWDAAFYDGVI